MWCTAFVNHHDVGPDSSMVDLLFFPALRRYFDANVQELGPVCFYCGLRGHKAKDCTNQRKELPCALCAQYGHNKSHCPSCESTVTCILTRVKSSLESSVRHVYLHVQCACHHPSFDTVATGLTNCNVPSLIARHAPSCFDIPYSWL